MWICRVFRHVTHHFRGIAGFPCFEEKSTRDTTNMTKQIQSARAVLEPCAAAEQSVHAHLTFRSNHPDPERCAPRVRKTGHPRTSPGVGLASCRFVGCC